MNITGRVEAKFYRDGHLYAMRKGSNIVVSAGKNLAALRLDNQGTAPSHMALGTGTTLPLEADTTLVTEILRVVFSPVPSISTNEITYQATFTSIATQTLAELGIFNAGAGGTMLARWLISPTVGWVSGNTLAVTWVLTFG